MSLERIKRTSLWLETLELRADDVDESKREELRSAFLKFRENASTLVSKISGELPGLTQHDISHLDALWETASLITGDKFQITPLEGFVLGSAILLHDSALCFEAYENGQDGVRNTLQWKDTYASIHESQINIEASEIEKQADFITLRELHAIQAESLLDKSWTDPSNGQELYLLENQTLRKHLGKLIGLIAASHHWDIDMLMTKLPGQQNSLASYPREWRIDPVKIACILRCADAAHLDNERAPDFLHALLKRHGVSFTHWQAQNRLATVDIDQSDLSQATLLFTSTIDFEEQDSESWFVAYDAVCLVDKEIKASNMILEKRNTGTSFHVNKVKGVESPETMAKYIKAENWKPCSAQVHVGNIEKIIQNLGGEMLYGKGSDILGVVLRELIQNARDAIHARIFVTNDLDGKISIKISKTAGQTWLTIEDNGIGMSERVLTGPLLDFGTSFWASNLVKSEFPGLRSSSFKSIGKFGIGFYSVFMIAEKIIINTKTWDSGVSNINNLKFNKGFSLRPILTQITPTNFSPLVSTQIQLQLKDDIIPDSLMIEIKSNQLGGSNFHVPLQNYISTICSGLDNSVYYKENENEEIKIHESIECPTLNKLHWLSNISFANFQTNSIKTKDYISKNVARLKPIIDNGKLLGLAAISTNGSNEQNFLSIATVGGLSHSVHNRSASNYIGYIDYSPKSASREIDDYSASESVIIDWADNQLTELLALELDPTSKYFASSALCHFKIDPSPLAKILISLNNIQTFMSFEQLAELALTTKIVFIESGFGGHIETHHDLLNIEEHALIRPLSNSSFLTLKFNDGVPVNNYSIADCLHRKILSKDFTPKWIKVENFKLNSFGQSMSMLTIQAL